METINLESLLYRRARKSALAALSHTFIPEPFDRAFVHDDDRHAISRFHRNDSEGNPSSSWRSSPLGYLTREHMTTSDRVPSRPMDLDSARALLRRQFPRLAYILEENMVRERPVREIAVELGVHFTHVQRQKSRALAILHVWTH